MHELRGGHLSRVHGLDVVGLLELRLRHVQRRGLDHLLDLPRWHLFGCGRERLFELSSGNLLGFN